MFSCEFCEISKNTFFYRTPLVSAFGLSEQFYKEIFWTMWVSYKNALIYNLLFEILIYFFEITEMQ